MLINNSIKPSFVTSIQICYLTLFITISRLTIQPSWQIHSHNLVTQAKFVKVFPTHSKKTPLRSGWCVPPQDLISNLINHLSANRILILCLLYLSTVWRFGREQATTNRVCAALHPHTHTASTKPWERMVQMKTIFVQHSKILIHSN